VPYVALALIIRRGKQRLLKELLLLPSPFTHHLGGLEERGRVLAGKGLD